MIKSITKSKKRTILTIFIIIAILILGVVGVYAYRNINEKPPVVVDQTMNNTESEGTDVDESETTLKGTLKGYDDLHWGKGTVEVIETQDGPLLSFGDDFEVAPGPDLFIYLSPNAPGEDLGEFASLGSIKSNTGAQQYNLPENYTDYKTVVVWCRAFGVTFATAELL
jgi:hypothetical protein